MRLKPWPAFVLVGLILAAASRPVEAGSAEAPEITDPSGDGLSDGWDLVKVWMHTPDVTRVNVTFELTKNPTHLPALFALHNRVTLWTVPTAGLPSGMNTMYFVLRFSVSTSTGTAGQPTFTGAYAFSSAAGTYTGPANELSIPVTVSGAKFAMSVTLDKLKGFDPMVHGFTKLYAQAVLMSTALVNTDASSLNLVYREWDRAPNSGFGKDFFPGPTLAPPVLPADFTLTGPENASLVSGSVATFPVSVSNQAADSAEITFEAAADEPETQVEVQPANATIPGGEATDVLLTLNTSLAGGSTTTVRLLATAQDGSQRHLNLTFSVEAAPSPSGGPAGSGAATDPAGTGPVASGDSTEEPAGADTPGPGWVGALAAAVLVVVGSRRRRTAR